MIRKNIYGDPEEAAAALPPPAHLPKLINHGGAAVPAAPGTPEETGVDPSVLSDLALKLANSVPRLTSEWAAEQLRLPPGVMERLFWQLREDQYLEILGQSGPLTYRYAITRRGREQARRLLEISGYVGPAPVALEAYAAMLQWQIARQPPVTSKDVDRALSPLVLSPGACEVASLAAASGRSLFLFGPAGNGKTSLAMLMRQVLAGELWIPYCISVESNIIRIYDPQCHQLAPQKAGSSARIDHRWLSVRRPAVVAGGEMTIAELDLAYSPSLRFYEAPPHVKANGGLFFLDDFGRQRIDPTDLLNRWIIPLEQQIDYLTLVTGQKIRIPFQLLLIVATNLAASADPAFLRRIGYRIHMDQPDEKRYSEIFRRYAQSIGLAVEEPLIASVLKRYKAENRDLRACEPRDLIERCRDICRLRHQAPVISQQLLDEAWRAYFGDVGHAR
jgi:predicted ATPase with chaperone activity